MADRQSLAYQMAQSCFRFELHCAVELNYTKKQEEYISQGSGKMASHELRSAVSFPFLTSLHDPATLASDEPLKENPTGGEA